MRHYLLAAATLVLTSSLALAGSSPESNATTLVNDKLVQPLAAKERDQGKFSRARPAPAERRVRLEGKPQQDSAGATFLTFAIDERQGWSDASDDANWNKAKLTGCVYPELGDVYIKRGNAFHPAIAALGKKTKAAPERTCHASAAIRAR